MAQFDVMSVRTTGERVVDCQSNLLRHLPTRFVIPLIPVGMDLEPSQRLNPVFEIGGEKLILGTQFAASISLPELEEVGPSLDRHAYEITGAIDMLVSGY